MMDLRFVEREVIIETVSAVIGRPAITSMKKIKILQWRRIYLSLQSENGSLTTIWTEWEDVRIEEQ